jgi:hypothetical protein
MERKGEQCERDMESVNTWGVLLAYPPTLTLESEVQYSQRR